MNKWTESQDKMIMKNMPLQDLAKVLNISVDSVRNRRFALRKKSNIKESVYHKFDSPLKQDGNCVILPDLEVPFHHSEFVNRVLDLAYEWGVNQAILAGDVLHFNSLSKFGPGWVEETKDGMSESSENKLMSAIEEVSDPSVREKLIQTVAEIGRNEEDDLSMGKELLNAKSAMLRFSDQFDLIDYVIGNHDGRLLRVFESDMFPDTLKINLVGDNPKWRIAPYYYSLLESKGRNFRIEHPRGAAQSTAFSLAAKFDCSVLMGHSHDLSFRFDVPGRHYAIQMGCCVDEIRLEYASQRSTTKPMHKLGAVIVRDGYPFLLHEESPWGLLKNL